MRRIEQTKAFRRDYKRESKSQNRTALERDFTSIVRALTLDQRLAARHRDHPLTGDWRDHRDCHVKPDLILIYRISDAERLQLVRLGSHSELGL